MLIKKEERYKVIFENYRFASEYRVKLITGWAAIYSGLAVAFSWVYDKSRSISWIIPFAAFLVIILIWFADKRHRPAIRKSKTVGANIEINAGIPENERYFTDIDDGLSHSSLIDGLSFVLLIFFGASAIFLFAAGGQLPQ